MEAVQAQLRLLLSARPYEEEQELVDWTLADAREAAAAKGVTLSGPAASADFVPVVRKSVTYIVAAVLVNDRGEVLMMQVG